MMCRYAFSGPYKLHYACFTCRKMFRQVSYYDRDLYVAFDANIKSDASAPQHKFHMVERICLCPQCHEPMHNMGLDFKPPRQTEVKQWRKVELLHAHGYTYSSCGCNGPGYRPKTLKEVPRFLAEEEEQRQQYARRTLNEERARERDLRRKKAESVRQSR